MKGDFTRFSFKPYKHYTGVLKQQGRVDLDSDWNEHIEIQDELDRIRTKDIIGGCGAPKIDGGFEVKIKDGDPTDIEIFPGRIYVDGILCELEKDAKYLDKPITYKNQPDYPHPPEVNLAEKKYLAYLDVWQRHITFIEDPEIREKALGGPDTTTRIKTVWQLKLAELSEDGALECDGIPPNDWAKIMTSSDVRLSAGTTPTPSSDNPCAQLPSGGFRGLENRLYRVEIHDGGKPFDSPVSDTTNFANIEINNNNEIKVIGETENLKKKPWKIGQFVEIFRNSTGTNDHGTLVQIMEVDKSGRILTLEPALPDGAIQEPKMRRIATFKWSRDNGSIAFPLDKTENADPKKIKVATMGRDNIQTIHQGDWVEVLNDVTELSGRPGTMAQVTDLPDRAALTIPLSKDVSKYKNKNIGIDYHPKVRRWDQKNEKGEKSDVLPVKSGAQIYLEDGIWVQFSGSNCKSGDYWAFAARTATNNVEEQTDEPPRGIKHYYCKLALISFGTENPVYDLRRVISLSKAMHVINTSWKNDAVYYWSDILNKGLSIDFDSCPDPELINDDTINDVMIVTIEYPSLFWSPPSASASRSFILEGKATLSEKEKKIQWMPLKVGPALNLIRTMHIWLMKLMRIDLSKIRMRAVLKGHTIWCHCGDQLLYLDGQAFGTYIEEEIDKNGKKEKISRIGLNFPSGDGRKASDFESWWYVDLGVGQVKAVPVAAEIPVPR